MAYPANSSHANQAILPSFDDSRLLTSGTFWQQLINETQSKINAFGSIDNLSDRHLVALDMLKFAAGDRPSMQFVSGKLLTTDCASDKFFKFLQTNKDLLSITSRSVGRILLQSQPIGTGFVVGNGYIMTNLQNLYQIADHINGAWLLKYGAQIEFTENTIKSKCFDFARSQPWENDSFISIIGNANIGCAILKIEPYQWLELPTPLILDDGQVSASQHDPILLMHYSKRNNSTVENYDALFQSFGIEPGTKRLAMGQVTSVLQSPMFTHDCITMGTADGAPIFRIHDGTAIVVGMHSSEHSRGMKVAQNLKHIVNATQDVQLNFL